jgi:hypothetical protein
MSLHCLRHGRGCKPGINWQFKLLDTGSQLCLPALQAADKIVTTLPLPGSSGRQVHASLMSLLWAGTPQEVLTLQPSQSAAIDPALASSNAADQEPSGDVADVGGTADPSLPAGEASDAASGTEQADGAAQGPTSGGARPPTQRPRLGPESTDPALVARLSCTAAGLELVRSTNAVFSETLAHTMMLLRVFSFS